MATTPNTRRILAIVSDVDLGLAFSTPGNHRQVWSIPIQNKLVEKPFNQVYEAMWSLHPTIVILPTRGYVELMEGVRAISLVRKWQLVRHSPERAAPQLPYAREYLASTRKGTNVGATEAEISALAHVMIHLEERTRDSTARIMKKLKVEVETEMGVGTGVA